MVPQKCRYQPNLGPVSKDRSPKSGAHHKCLLKILTLKFSDPSLKLDPELWFQRPNSGCIFLPNILNPKQFSDPKVYFEVPYYICKVLWPCIWNWWPYINSITKKRLFTKSWLAKKILRNVLKMLEQITVSFTHAKSDWVPYFACQLTSASQTKHLRECWVAKPNLCFSAW